MSAHPYHQLTIACPRCDAMLPATKFFANAAGKICLNTVCGSCDVSFAYLLTMAQLKQICRGRDKTQEEHADLATMPVTTPVL